MVDAICKKFLAWDGYDHIRWWSGMSGEAPSSTYIGGVFWVKNVRCYMGNWERKGLRIWFEDKKGEDSDTSTLS